MLVEAKTLLKVMFCVFGWERSNGVCYGPILGRRFHLNA
jgi:hypothetical protein